MRFTVFCDECLLLLALVTAAPVGFAAQVTIGRDNIIQVNGETVFPIGFTLAPPPGGKTPAGDDAYREIKSNGAVFHRCGPGPRQWGAEAEAKLDRLLEASAQADLLCGVSIADLQAPADAETEQELRRLVRKYKDHPGVGYWKGADEPEWGKVPVERVRRFYEIVRELDPSHPVWITQAPRGTIESLKRYDPFYDIGAIDIYPIGYPPGGHSHLPNKNISVAGDYARWLREITGGRKPFWMILQISWSGVIKPGRTLRFPTLPEERYMTYQSIINGARGLGYFGGNLEPSMNERDKKLGWNWTFYSRVLKPVLQELAPDSPLHPALVAPDSKLPLRIEGAPDVEFCTREAGGRIFILAAKREGATVQAKFSGLPANISGGEVLFEEPRKVAVSGGSFSDWFGPNEVHLYSFSRP